MPLRAGAYCDTAVWVAADLPVPEDDRVITTGSSGTVHEILPGNRALVGWGSGLETVCKIGREVVTPQQAANRGVEPWASLLPLGGPGDRRPADHPVRPPRPKRDAVADILFPRGR